MPSEHSKTTPSTPPQHEPVHEEQQQGKESKDLEEPKKKGTGAAGVVIAIVCLVLEAIIFLFCVVGTPIDVFKAKSKVKPRMCYSMWGSKQCGPHKTNPSGSANKGFPTSNIKSVMTAAAAFSIISIFFTLLALILTILVACKCMSGIIAGVISIIAFISTLIVWACQAGVYYKKYRLVPIGPRYQIKDSYHYHASFGLFVTAWCLQTIEMILVFFA
uniref:G-amastin n=1 Tax=Angomonas deanei TaxID=59799 RepID=C6K3Q5_9TRYP|nr:g-amastin [Angomonas deanei]